MAIPETQLSIWSNQGATVSSQTTYNSIKSCIDGNSWNDDIQYNIYLQGSYKNSTNIYGNSDVDVVVEFSSVFYSNKNIFSQETLKEFDDYFENGKYTLQAFKISLISRLIEYYGATNIEVGNKAIRVKGGNGRLDGDIIVCAEYRKFKSFSKYNPNDYIQGIIFWEATTGKEVINYPAQHFRNGASKNSESDMNFKPSVRILKNMKAKLVSANIIAKDTASSYFVECLVYNVPSSRFKRDTYQNRIIEILEYWGASTRENTLGDFLTQSEQKHLFGNSDQQWNTADANKFITEIINFWNAG